MNSFKFPSFKITPELYDADEGLEYFDGGSMFYDTCNLDEQVEKIKEQLDSIYHNAFSKEVKSLFKEMNKLANKFKIDVYDLENMLRESK